jgi:superfamily II DNA/RNA helicase
VRAAPFHTSALILAPTREFAQQIDDRLRKLGAGLRLRSVTIRFCHVWRQRNKS